MIKKYNKSEYKILSERFNKMSFLQKLITIKSNPTLFSIECDGVNLRLRLEDDAMNLGLDSYFSFPEFVDFEVINSLCKLVDLNVKELK